MIATKTIMAVAIVLSTCMLGSHAQNESFPWVNETNKDFKSAGILNQRVFVDSTQQDNNTYYQLTILQEGVQDSINMRCAIQWLRNITDQRGTEYRGVVFQVLTTQTTRNPTISWATANDYLIYNNTGGQLVLEEYLEAVLLAKPGFTSNTGSSAFNTGNFVSNVRGEVIKTTSGIEVQINFTIPNLDPIGENRLWYNWAFYTDVIDVSTIEGNSHPYFYSTYASIWDFFPVEDWLTNFWIMLATSLFWLFGEPFMFGFGVYQHFSFLFAAWNAAMEFNRWPGSERFQWELYIGLSLVGLEQVMVTMVFFCMTWIPILGPISNFVAMLYLVISYQYQYSTQDRRIWYGKESDAWLPVPQIIESDAFRDIHFPSGDFSPDKYPSNN